MKRGFSELSAGLLSGEAGLTLAHRGLSSLLKLIICTIKVRVEGEQQVLDVSGDGPPVFAFWHGKQMPMYAYKSKWKLATLVSKSKDGELLARILHDLGHEIARGSSTRGGTEGFSLMADFLSRGYAPCFAADGPKGPFHMSKPGPIRLASQSGRPLVPASAAASRYMKLGTWDRMEIPAPFSNIAFVFGSPVTFRKDMSADELYSATHILSAAIDKCTLRAEEMLKRNFS